MLARRMRLENCSKNTTHRKWAKGPTIFAHISEVAKQPDMTFRHDCGFRGLREVLLGSAGLNVRFRNAGVVDQKISIPELNELSW